MAEHRAAAAIAAERPVSRTAAIVIALIWAASIAFAGWMAYRYFDKYIIALFKRWIGAGPAFRQAAGRACVPAARRRA
jgi:hypothetical protein